MQLINLDYVAKRYGCLPTLVLKSGTSLDMQIANFAANYENYLTAKAQGKKPERKLSQTKMLTMLEKAKQLQKERELKYGNQTSNQ